MNLHLIDWLIILAVLIFLTLMAYYTKRFTKSVAGFLAAERCGGRYLLTMSQGISSLGAITVVASFEKYYHAGFAALWWSDMLAPIGLIVTLSGWIIYRYRQTRAMTMAEFFEMRYSRNFRIFAGMLAWLSGIINYGIFPAVTSRFFIYFCGIPQYTVPIGSFQFNVTQAIVMALFLGIAVLFTFMGGQIAVMITDFFQAQLVYVVFLVIIFVLLFKFNWGDIVAVLKEVPEGQSRLNPFDQGSLPDFNFWFFAICAFIQFYSYMAWQGSQGYFCSAKSPHEARMAGILSSWRAGVTMMTVVFMPVCAYVFMHGKYGEELTQVQNILATIGDSQIQEQVTVPVVLSKILPVGVLGLFASVMMAAALSTDDTYLHSWGSIFIQDVVLPIRKKTLTPKQHIKLLRFSILGVAIFAWFFSVFFPLKEYIFMFCQITGSIFIAGAGSAIIGGLYWKRSTTAGAWSGLIAGAVLSLLTIIARNIIWPYLIPSLQASHPDVLWLQNIPESFPLNGMQMSFWCSISAVGIFVVVSLLTKPDPHFSMDKLLHRGKYADTEIQKRAEKPKRGLKALFNISDEFTFSDKVLYFLVLGWTVGWFIVFICGTIYNLVNKTSDDGWAKWWHCKLIFMTVICAVTILWFSIGGLMNLKEMFGNLKSASASSKDDGTVVKDEDEEDTAASAYQADKVE